jgi:hypothetical protein
MCNIAFNSRSGFNRFRMMVMWCGDCGDRGLEKDGPKYVRACARGRQSASGVYIQYAIDIGWRMSRAQPLVTR